MSTPIATYSAVCAPTTNQMGKIKPNENGYWPMVLGGFDLANEHGTIYQFTQKVRSLFEDDSILLRRVEKGLCRSEYGHPKLDGLNRDQQLVRIQRLDPDRICAHIMKVSLESTKDENNKPIVLCKGLVCPSGPFASVVERQLNNPHENVAFSIRCFNDVQVVNGKLVKYINSIINWDWVPEGGIGVANKFYTVSLEEFENYAMRELVSFNFTPANLDKAIRSLETGEFSTEDTSNTLRMVKTDLGWEKVQIVEPRSLLATWK